MTEEDRERVLAIEKLRAIIEEGVGKKCLMSQFELEAEEQKRVLGQRLMDEKIAALKPEDGRPKSCPRCGKSAKRRATAVERTFRSMSGEHAFRRDYYYCERCSKGFYPRDAFLGLPEHGAETIELERRMADFAINDAYEVTSERWNFHYLLKGVGESVSASLQAFRQEACRGHEEIDVDARDNQATRGEGNPDALRHERWGHGPDAERMVREPHRIRPACGRSQGPPRRVSKSTAALRGTRARQSATAFSTCLTAWC